MLQATLGMQLSSESSSTAEDVGVWQSAKPWTNSATWNTYDGTNAWSTPGGDTTGSMQDQESIGASGNVGSWFFWDVDSTMQGWVDGNPPAIDGLELSPTQGSSAPNKLAFQTGYSSSDYPYLFVYYQPRIGDYPGSHYDSQSLTDRSTLGVNVADGNMMLSNNDVHLAGVDGLDLNIGRYYNDLSSDLDSFGQGWSMGPGADTYLAIPSDGDNTVVYSDGTGDLQTYYQNTNGTWHYPPGTDVNITMNAPTTSTATQYSFLFRHSGITETFDTTVSDPVQTLIRLTTLSDRNGNTIYYYYNSSGQLTSIRDTYGNTTNVYYSSAGYVSKIVDPTGRTYQYTQNSSNELSSYTDPAGYTTYYTYDAYGNLTQITTAGGNITKVAYDAGNTDRVSSVTRLVHPTDNNGPTTYYSYAPANGTCPTTPSGSMQTTVTNPDTYSSTYCTDDLSRLIKTIDPNGNTRGTSYSTDGYVQSLTSGLQTPTAFQYSPDNNDNVTQIQQGTGTGSITTKYQYPTTGGANQYLPTQSTDAQQNNTTYTYDANGNEKTITDQLASQNQAKINYNSNGTVQNSTDPDGNETQYSYTNGNLTTIAPNIPTGSKLNPITLTYDSANRVKTISSVANGAGHEVDYNYDDFDRITQEVFKNASGTTVATIGYTYDKDGNLLTRTDSNGTTTDTYDGLNRLQTQTFPDFSTSTYGYDPAGNLTSLQDAGGTVTYGYDHANQLTAITDPGASLATIFGYDDDGNLTNVNYPSGASIVRHYNPEDQLKSVTDNYKASNGSPLSVSYSFTYNGDLRATMTNVPASGPTLITTYTYDQLNRLTEAKTANGPTTTNDQKYKLDGAGNVFVRDPERKRDELHLQPRERDRHRRRPHLHLRRRRKRALKNGNGFSATYNALGQMTSTTSGSTNTNYSYLGDGQKELIADGTSTLHNDLLGLASDQTGTSTHYYTREIDGQPIDELNPDRHLQLPLRRNRVSHRTDPQQRPPRQTH